MPIVEFLVKVRLTNNSLQDSRSAPFLKAFSNSIAVAEVQDS